ncbi:MAG: branched-chain amino acid ABC transporter permease [Candidatus Lokiarchaeota archaeon]|nr:branched-chain amino acid ABC transporter permease [Candidatus Lokiarchaeota archaeon]
MVNPLSYILVTGTIEGTITALIAMGFSLVYGVGGILNQSHGVFYMFIGFMTFYFLSILGTSSYFLAAIIAIIVVAIISALMYYGLIKPVQDNMISVLIITLAIAIILEELIGIIWGTEAVGLPILQQIFTDINRTEPIWDETVPTQVITAFWVSMITIIITIIAIKKLKIGQSIRAVSQDREAAELMGINSNWILCVTLMLSMILAGIAAILYLPNRPMEYNHGMSILILAFAIVVIGGLGSLPGSVVGAFVLSFATKIYEKAVPQFDFLSSFVPTVVIIIILLLRPQGLFGEKED